MFNLPIPTCICPRCICSGRSRSWIHFWILLSESPFLQLSALFSPKIAESQECGRVESQLADWIVFCSISGCIKQPRLWTYKKVMDASSLRLDRSELTSAEGRKGKKKEWERERLWFTDQAGERREEDECQSAPTADSHRCKAAPSLLLSAVRHCFHMMFGCNVHLEEITELAGNHKMLWLASFILGSNLLVASSLVSAIRTLSVPLTPHPHYSLLPSPFLSSKV